MAAVSDGGLPLMQAEPRRGLAAIARGLSALNVVHCLTV